MLLRRFALLALMALALPAWGELPLVKYASPVRDISVRTTLVSTDMKELKVIGTEYAQGYRVTYTDIWFREPNMLRVTSKAGLLSAVSIINGNTKRVSAGPIKKTYDLKKEPRKRQDALVLGLVTPSGLFDYTDKFLRKDKVNGVDVMVYELKHKVKPEDSYKIVFVDPNRKVVVRLMSYQGDGRLKLDSRFLNPVKLNGVWVPTRTEVYNANGKLGGVTKFENIKVNTGLSDSLFKL